MSEVQCYECLRADQYELDVAPYWGYIADNDMLADMKWIEEGHARCSGCECAYCAFRKAQSS